LKSKNIIPINQVIEVFNKILKSDPDPNGSNCVWLVDAYLNDEFKLDEEKQSFLYYERFILLGPI
jgi:hypothetical protein